MIKWIFRKVNSLEKEYLPNLNYYDELAKLEKRNDLSHISNVYWCLLSEDILLKKRTIMVLTSIMKQLTNKNYICLDKMFREKTSMNWSYDWKNQQIEQLFLPTTTIDEKILLTGLSSFHPNGYFREKAVDELIKYEGKEVISFLIIRSNDWVEVIRNKAVSELVKRINIDNFMHIIDNIYLIHHMKLYKRVELTPILKELDILFSNVTKEQLLLGVRSKEVRTREYCLDTLVKRNLLNNNCMIDLILSEPIMIIRAKIMKKLINKLPRDIILNNKTRLLNDKGYMIRVLTITALFNNGYFLESSDLEFGLIDKYASVRDITRFYINKLTSYNFIDFYSNALKKNITNESILGLTEVATINETDLLKTFLNTDKIYVYKAVLKTIATFDFSQCEKEVIESLGDKRIGISNEARRILIHNKGQFDCDNIYKLYHQSIINHIIKNAAIVLCNTPKWHAIKYIVEICSNENSDISEIGYQSFHRWKINFNLSFIPPTTQQINDIIATVKEFGGSLKEKDIDFINFIIDKNKK